VDKDLIPIVIDLGVKRKKKLDEFFLTALGGWVELLLKKMFGEPVAAPSVRLRGTKEEIATFMSALGREKKYMDAYKEYGLADQRTLNNKYKLQDAVKKFESKTGLIWPFK